jgi:iron-sulfur cluster assembly protein
MTTEKRLRPSLINVTDLAKFKLNEMIQARGRDTAGIRIGIRTKGCSGLSYTLEYCDEVSATDEMIDVGSTKLLIDPKSILFIIGSTLDYKEEEFSTGFSFSNPNEKGRCGCGQSFHV